MSKTKKTSRQRRGLDRPMSMVDALSFAWFFLDGVTHLLIEAGYLWMALVGNTANFTDSFMGGIWREYARADKRFVRLFVFHCITLAPFTADFL